MSVVRSLNSFGRYARPVRTPRVFWKCPAVCIRVFIHAVGVDTPEGTVARDTFTSFLLVSGPAAPDEVPRGQCCRTLAGPGFPMELSVTPGPLQLGVQAARPRARRTFPSPRPSLRRRGYFLFAHNCGLSSRNELPSNDHLSSCCGPEGTMSHRLPRTEASSGQTPADLSCCGSAAVGELTSQSPSGTELGLPRWPWGGMLF